MKDRVQVLDTNKVGITTASVEIKVLTVNGKQMTQAVFRQLIQESIVDPDTGDLLGTPWGIVNYRGESDFIEKYVLVVWQKGDMLRRCAVARDPQLVLRSKDPSVLRRWAETYEKLARLDQLFIAV